MNSKKNSCRGNYMRKYAMYLLTLYDVAWVVWFQNCNICHIIKSIWWFLFQEHYQTEEVKMTQYQIILAHLKTIIENQDKILILMNKVVKFLEHFKPLIEWVSTQFKAVICTFIGNFCNQKERLPALALQKNINRSVTAKTWIVDWIGRCVSIRFP